MLTAAEAFLSLVGPPDSLGIVDGRTVVTVGGIVIDGGAASGAQDLAKGVTCVRVEARLHGGAWHASKIELIGQEIAQTASTRTAPGQVAEERQSAQPAQGRPSVPTVAPQQSAGENVNSTAGAAPGAQGGVFAQRMRERAQRELAEKRVSQGGTAAVTAQPSGTSPGAPSGTGPRPAAAAVPIRSAAAGGANTRSTPAGRASFDPGKLGPDEFSDVPF